MAVQGGLLLGLLAKHDDEDATVTGWRRYILPVSAFLAAKLVAYVLLGLLLGWLGESIILSPTAKLWLQTLAAVVMVITGLRLFWPRLLPWLAISPPAGVRRFIRNRAKSQALVAPAILGTLTVFIPCGTTQSMEVNAIAAGSALQGALIMGAFTLGTAPLFFLIGVAAKGTAVFQRRLTAVAATIVIILGLYNFNGVLVAIGSPFSWQHQLAAARLVLTGETQVVDSGPVSDTPTIQVNPIGYEPNYLRVPAGRPVTLTLSTTKNTGCTSVFRIPSQRIERTLPATGDTVVTTTFAQPGQYTFSCGMGMFTGTIEAV